MLNMTPNQHEKDEWSRMAQAAYRAGHNTAGHRFSVAASLSRDMAMPLSRFDDLQRQYRAWLVFGEYPQD